MSILTYPLGFIGGGELEPFYNNVIENSLRSSDGDSAYLTSVMDTPTSRRKFTYSAWIKLDDDYTAGGTDRFYYETRVSSTVFHGVYFGSYAIGYYYNDGTADYGQETSGSANPAKYRDVSAWYHCVWAFDTT